MSELRPKWFAMAGSERNAVNLKSMIVYALRVLSDLMGMNEFTVLFVHKS